MFDDDAIDTLQAQVELERRLVEVFQAEYNAALAELHGLLQRQALKSLS